MTDAGEMSLDGVILGHFVAMSLTRHVSVDIKSYMCSGRLWE